MERRSAFGPQRYRLAFHDEFDGDALDRSKWLPVYLPQWSSAARSAPRYRIADGALTLFIAPDQEPWCPEFDRAVRCSSLQTGLFAGPLGSDRGQHRFNSALRVREEQETTRTFVPQFGYFELRAKAVMGPRNLVSLWMIGFEDAPQRSGEIAVMEIFGSKATPDATTLGYGIKPWHDPLLKAEFYEDRIAFDVGAYHTYAAEWRPEGVAFYLDGKELRRIGQSPQYPMQFMLNVYDLPSEDGVATLDEPSFTIDYFRAFAPVP